MLWAIWTCFKCIQMSRLALGHIPLVPVATFPEKLSQLTSLVLGAKVPHVMVLCSSS